MEVSSWQTKLSTVRERNLYAFNLSLFCDVEFSVVDSNGGKVSLRAHKYVLAISSPVFEAMFYGELAETGTTIVLPDCTKEGLQEMLHYVYSDELNISESNVMEVLYLAKKYILPFLEQKCREYLEKQLTPEDVFIVLPQVKQMADDDLEQHCWDIVDRETKRAVSSEPFFDVSHEVLCQVLSRDRLKIKEVDLFQEVDKWVLKRIEEKEIENSGENKRVILGEEAIRLVRFPLMSQKEFEENVLPSQILNTDEITQLIQIFSSFSPSTKIFNEKKRREPIVQVVSLRFSMLSSGTWGYTRGKIDAIDFSVNKAVSLVGVRLYGSQGNIYDVDLKIYQKDTILSFLSSRFPTEDKLIDNQYYWFTVTLDKPVPLDPGVRYTIAAAIKGPSSCYGEKGKESDHYDEDLVIQYLPSERSSYGIFGTCVGKGQIPAIILESN